MYDSNFSYSVTRPYPHRWFSLVVVIGGICATALVTLFNVAVNGYDLQSSFSSDPNSTMSPENPAWFEKRPWNWAGKDLPNCEPHTISIGSQVTTGNHLFQYVVTNITTGANETPYYISYLNYGLYNCRLDTLKLEWPSNRASFTGIRLKTYCTVYNGSTSVSIGLILTLDDDVVETLLDSPWLQKNALFGLDIAYWYMENYLLLSVQNEWGVNATFTTMTASGDESLNSTENVVEAHLDFLGPNEASVSLDILPPSTREWNTFSGRDIVTQNWIYSNTDAGSLLVNESDPLVDAAIYISAFAKSLMSAILADLGNSNVVNIFNSPELTIAFLNDTLQLGNQQDEWFELLPDLEYLASYGDSIVQSSTNATIFEEWLENDLPPIQQTAISTQYLCQIPRRKPWGSLLVSIAIADLVFLQAIWSVFTWVTTYFTERKYSDARYCAGCAKAVALGRLNLDDEPTSTPELRPSSSRSVHAAGTATPLLALDIDSNERDVSKRICTEHREEL